MSLWGSVVKRQAKGAGTVQKSGFTTAGVSSFQLMQFMSPMCAGAIPFLRRKAIALVFLPFIAPGLLAGDGVVRGMFVQKKFLRDIDVTLTSTGRWSFEKDKAFSWNTLKPVPSQFVATPTNYSFTAGGRTVSRRLEMKISNLAQVFEMKEMKGVVDRVEQGVSDPVYKADGIEIPSSMRVLFKNGDRLEITLSR